MDQSKAKVGGLAQRFNLSQTNTRNGEQSAASDLSGQVELATNHFRPVQIPGSQVLRRSDGSDVRLMSSLTACEALAGNGSRNSQRVTSFSAPRASVAAMEIESPETVTSEQLRTSDLEQRLRVATQRIQDLENDAKAHAEELLVARTQARIEIDQEVIRLQQEVETLGEHEDRLIRELVASDAQLKGLKTTERQLRIGLSHFRTIYCLKHAYNNHLKTMNAIKRCAAKRLHEKFLETEGKYMEAAYELYDFLEANGLQETLPPDVKAMLARTKGKNE